jgi:hypothetical protein
MNHADGTALAIVTAIIDGDYERAHDLAVEATAEREGALDAIDTLAWATVTMAGQLAKRTKIAGKPMTVQEAWQRYTLVVARHRIDDQ